jgi:hypothetical protein
MYIYLILEVAPTLAGVKLDLVTKNYESVSETMARMPVIPPHPQSVGSLGMSRTTSGKTRTTSAASSQKAKTPATMKTYEMPIQPLVGILNMLSLGLDMFYICILSFLGPNMFNICLL